MAGRYKFKSPGSTFSADELIGTHKNRSHYKISRKTTETLDGWEQEKQYTSHRDEINSFSPSYLSFLLQNTMMGSVWIAGAAGAMGKRRREGEAQAAEMEILYLLKQVIFQPAHSSKVHHWIIKCGRLRICFSK